MEAKISSPYKYNQLSSYQSNTGRSAPRETLTFRLSVLSGKEMEAWHGAYSLNVPRTRVGMKVMKAIAQ